MPAIKEDWIARTKDDVLNFCVRPSLSEPSWSKPCLAISYLTWLLTGPPPRNFRSASPFVPLPSSRWKKAILSSSLALPRIARSFAWRLVIADERMSLSVAASHVNSFASSGVRGSGSWVRAHLPLPMFELRNSNERNHALGIVWRDCLCSPQICRKLPFVSIE